MFSFSLSINLISNIKILKSGYQIKSHYYALLRISNTTTLEVITKS